MPDANAGSGRLEWSRHWPIVLTGTLGVALSATHFYSIGVMIPRLEAEFGWSRAEISYGPMMAAIGAVIISPVVGGALDRFGAKRIGLIGAIYYCLGIALLSTATSSILSWCLMWTALAVGWVMTGATTWAGAVSGVFNQSRGLALAVVLCGTGIGAAIVPPIASHLIAAFDWRMTYVALACLWAIIVVPTIIFLVPSHLAAGSRERAKAATGRGGGGFASRSFLLLALAAFLMNFTVGGLMANVVPILTWRGLAAEAAAWTAGLAGVGLIVGRVSAGYMLDRLPPHVLACISALLPLVASLLLMMSHGSAGLSTAAAVIIGLAGGSSFSCTAYLASRHFQPGEFGKLFGAISGLISLVVGLGPVAVSRVFDQVHSYEPVLWGLAPLALGASILYFAVGPSPRPAA